MNIAEAVEYNLQVERWYSSHWDWPYWPEKWHSVFETAWQKDAFHLRKLLRSGKIHNDVQRFLSLSEEMLDPWDVQKSLPSLTLRDLHTLLTLSVKSNYRDERVRAFKEEIAPLKGIGKRRMNVLILKPHASWAHLITEVMEDPDEALKNLSRKEYVHGTTWTLQSIRSLRQWAAPFYPGPVGNKFPFELGSDTPIEPV